MFSVTDALYDASRVGLSVFGRYNADGEKWELNRDAKAVVKGELKVGAKVTIQCTMTVATVEVKPAR